ncbi:MAG: hypothetical protein BVN33_06120 [Proteobacteria bacterium ST_bin13]|nr:MAG: hypothetical protein BVN33_06120 [Proteobacteria bacterium ST_bin13]
MTVQAPLNIPQRAKFRARDYRLLVESGALDRYARTELIDGEIWAINAAYSAHAKLQSAISFALMSALRDAASPLILFTAVSIDLSDDANPEPDLVVAEDHEEGPLPLSKVKLVVEISDATLSTDLGRKAALYATAGIPEYWVADVEAKVIHQQWAPEGEAYAQLREVAFGERIEAMTVAGLVVESVQP